MSAATLPANMLTGPSLPFLRSGSPIAALLAKIIAKRDQLRDLAALVDGAKLLDLVLTYVEAYATAEAEELLNLRQAAAVSGYSEDHLGRLVREGNIPNHGKLGAPLLRRADLPHKAPRKVASSAPVKYDLRADAHFLAPRLT